VNAQTKVQATSLLEALPLALAAVENAKKDANNPHFKSKYSTLASVIAAIRPVADHGIWFRQVPLACERGVAYETFYIGHGEEISAGISEVPVAKGDAQGVGSAKTYARRYGLMDAFGIAPEDDDGNAAAKAPPRQQAAPKFISDEQWAEVTGLMQATNTDAGKFCKAFGIESVKALTVDAYPKAKAQLERKLAQMGETVDA
jgi:hypothetical protein